MNRFIILVVVSGACACTMVGDGDEGAVQGSQTDISSSARRDVPVGDTEAALTCDGSPGQWPGCRGNGCAVCAELVGNAACYFPNHPACARNTTCAGEYFTCNDACPQPTSADFSLPPCRGPCGNGLCDVNESCTICPEDCGSCCGNGTCGGNESCETCPEDCGSCCGNGTCDNNESCETCPGDCGGGGTCGNGAPCCHGVCQDGSFCR
jgi:hypothetical protein